MRAAAAQTYTLLWSLHPESDAAAVAEHRLDELEPSLDRKRDGPAWRRRADTLFRKRNNEAALAAYEAALSKGLSDLGDGTGREASGPDPVSDAALRRGGESLPADSAGRRHTHLARPLAGTCGSRPRGDRRVREAGERTRRERGAAVPLPGGATTGWAREDRARQAIPGGLWHAGGARSSFGRAALWRLAWGAYREGRYADAISSLDALIAAERDPIGGLRSRYWRARCLEGLGRVGATRDGLERTAANRPRGFVQAGFGLGNDSEAAAVAEFQSIARNYPLSYYGWRARMHVPIEAGGHGLESSPPGDPLATPPPPGKRKVTSRALTRARILLEAGNTDWALDELGIASRRVGGLSDRLELAQLFSSAGGYRDAQRLVVDPYQETLARGPTATLEQLWWYAWPAAYSELVDQATQVPGSVSPALVFSIMREESGFRPTVVSPVGARGLLQIMQPTGERLARTLGYQDFSADDLFEPMTNIRLGAHYLAELSRQFDGRLSAAIASYNAGPVAVSGWLEERPGAADDEWVESIPYEQTRSYVKRVLRSLQAYRLLY